MAKTMGASSFIFRSSTQAGIREITGAVDQHHVDAAWRIFPPPVGCKTHLIPDPRPVKHPTIRALLRITPAKSTVQTISAQLNPRSLLWRDPLTTVFASSGEDQKVKCPCHRLGDARSDFAQG
jgi:hypothetical protein